MPRTIRLTLAAAALLFLPGLPADALDHCASRARIEPVPGDPAGWRLTTPRGTLAARSPLPARPAGTPDFVIEALDVTFDADGDPGTVVDTLIVPVGSTVRWQLVTGIHTVTNGEDSGDPNAGQAFSYLLDQNNPTFDSTFTAPTTLPFFCFFHEPSMVGTLIVQDGASVPAPALPAAARFARPPAPNPARGAVSFAVALPREERVRLEVLDLAGRRVASLHEGVLGPGEHGFRWDGLSAAGRRAPAGLYRARLRAGSASETRAFSLLR